MFLWWFLLFIIFTLMASVPVRSTDLCGQVELPSRVDNSGLVQIKHKWTLINEGVLDYNHKIRQGGNLSICPGLTSPCDYWVMIDLAHGDKAKYERDVSTCTLQKKKSGINLSEVNDFAWYPQLKNHFLHFPCHTNLLLFFFIRNKSIDFIVRKGVSGYFLLKSKEKYWCRGISY